MLGLYFCCQEPCEDRVEPVPQAFGTAKTDGVRLAMNSLGPRKVAFDPYPFDIRPFHVQLSSKRLPKLAYPDLDAFRRAYFQAPVELMDFELV